MGNVQDIQNIEDGCDDQQTYYESYQRMIDSGLAWRLQGAHGREAMRLITEGRCMLGEVGHRDYWGNYVPSRTEVAPGTKGSPEYGADRGGATCD